MSTEILSPTQFPLEDGDSLAPAHQLINAYLRRIPSEGFARSTNGYAGWAHIRTLHKEAARDVLTLPVAQQLDCIRASARFSYWSRFKWGWSSYKPETDLQMAYEYALDNLCHEILSSERDWSEEEIQDIVVIAVPYGFQKSDHVTPIVELYLTHHALTPSLHASLELVRGWNASLYRLEHWLKLGKVLGENLVLQRGEKWADGALAFIGGEPEKTREKWRIFLLNCIQSEKAKPNPKWLKTARTAIDEIGEGVLENCICAWCADYDISDSPREINQSVFKGLVWTASLLSRQRIASALGTLASSLSHPSGSHGVKVSLQLFNACVWSLGEMREPEARDQLLTLKAQTRGSRLKSVEKALDVMAARQ